ncbi:MAG: adenylate kinase [Verrucomicrobia bacterium]|nr:adenylate kinase [Verrucomicrobiota bacterium]
MHIALLGPSGAGKGTQAVKLCSRFNLRHFSIGDLLRKNLEARTALGLLARKYMDRCELVPDEVVEAMIEERLQRIPAEQGILLDGFPRTPEQAGFLDDLFKRSGCHLDAVIYLKLDEEPVLYRLQGRLVCRRCHTPCHAQLKPPLKPGICDVCGGDLQPRPDDSAEVARRRLRVFQRHIGSVLEYYQPSNRLHLVDAGSSIDAVYADIVALLDDAQRREARAATREEIARLQPVPPPAAALVAPTSKHALNLVLLGGPGSGKGTQAENLEREFQLCHVASGDLFRENLKNSTRLGLLAKSYMDRGELVPDDITEAMVEERLARVENGRGFLLDGFPRTLPQAVALTEMLAKLGRPLSGVLYIRVFDATLVERLSGRWICRACQTPYHLLFKPSSRAGVCDKCGGELYQRDDDKPDTVRARLKTFHRQTEPLIAYYQHAGSLSEIDGEGNVVAIGSRLSAVVKELLERT